MRVRFALAILAAASALPVGEEAAACVYLPIATIGEEHLSEAERERRRAAERRQEAREVTRLRRARARAALANGIDAPSELAEMLVPNIRPIPIDRSDCGPMNEIDLAEGEETIEDLLAGTPHAALADDFPSIERRWRYPDGPLLSFGIACNAEFRSRFAAHLRRRLSPAQIGEAYLFLAARSRIPERNIGSTRPLRRLVAFEGSARRPPVRWFTEDRWQERAIRRWTARNPTGRLLREAADLFWGETGPILSDPARACSEANARRPALQAEIGALYEAAAARRREAIERRR